MSCRLTIVGLAMMLVLAGSARAQTAVLPALPPTPSGIAAPRLGGYVQARETWERKIGLTGTLNRVRLTADGSLPNRFSYRVMAEFEAGGGARTTSSVSLRD